MSGQQRDGCIISPTITTNMLQTCTCAILENRTRPTAQNPSAPARSGRRQCNDMILNNRFSRNDPCYFDSNKETGELLLHDISEKKDTELDDVDGTGKPSHPQIWKTPRQCVVVLAHDPYRSCDREWILIPRSTPGDQGEAAFTEERLVFAGQPDPERTDEACNLCSPRH